MERALGRHVEACREFARSHPPRSLLGLAAWGSALLAAGALAASLVSAAAFLLSGLSVILLLILSGASVVLGMLLAGLAGLAGVLAASAASTMAAIWAAQLGAQCGMAALHALSPDLHAWVLHLLRQADGLQLAHALLGGMLPQLAAAAAVAPTTNLVQQQPDAAAQPSAVRPQTRLYPQLQLGGEEWSSAAAASTLVGGSPRCAPASAPAAVALPVAAH